MRRRPSIKAVTDYKKKAMEKKVRGRNSTSDVDHWWRFG
jgi:hypothetical protein